MNYTLITGASKGIGRALAEEFANYQCNLLLTARSAKELEELARELEQRHKVKVRTIAIDLLQDGAAEKLYQYCLKEGLNVRVLVNNAGMGVWSYFADSDLEKQFEMMDLNQRVVMKLCHLFIPMLRKMPDPHILNVASTAAFQPFPGFSIYAASKAFVFSFSRSLRFELKEEGINVTCLNPGPTDTTFFSNADFDHQLDKTDGIKMPVEEVARKGVEAMLAKKAVYIPGFSNKLGAWFSKHLPSGLTTFMLGKLVKYERK